MDICAMTGTAYGYDYGQIPKEATEEGVRGYCARNRKLFAAIAKGFDDRANTEWAVRHYLALKYILAATVLGTSAAYCEQRNVRITLPYLKYYMLFNCCRSFLFTLPCFQWQGVVSMKMSHSKILAAAIDRLRLLDVDAPSRWGSILHDARDQRELFSYQFPATGMRAVGETLVSLGRATEVARLLVELAQVNSECLEAAITKHTNGSFNVEFTKEIERLAMYEGNETQLIDDDDAFRVSQLLSRVRRPNPLTFMATDGLVEDFFGSWFAKEEKDGNYEPDADWRLLFELT